MAVFRRRYHVRQQAQVFLGSPNEMQTDDTTHGRGKNWRENIWATLPVILAPTLETVAGKRYIPILLRGADKWAESGWVVFGRRLWPKRRQSFGNLPLLISFGGCGATSDTRPNHYAPLGKRGKRCINYALFLFPDNERRRRREKKLTSLWGKQGPKRGKGKEESHMAKGRR